MSRRKLWVGGAIAVALVLAYLLAWPVSVDPVAWQAPPDPGYSGDFATNRRLAGLELFDLYPDHGPEDLALDSEGRVYTAVESGAILRLTADGHFERWAETGGRPLGIEFASTPAGEVLYVADAYRGLLAIGEDRQVRVLADTAGGVPIRYADDVDIAADGTVYFTDASTKFGARENGGTYPASVLDLTEHRGHGRMLAYDPQTGATTVALEGLQFANGITISHDQRSVLIAETGMYRVIRWWRTGPRAGETDPVLGPLPGFPDNLSRGRDGRYWVGLVSPRTPALDLASGWPAVRRIFERLPASLKPKATPYPHVIAFDERGAVVADLQDPDGPHAFVTGVLETEEHLYLSSLRAHTLARAPAGLVEQAK